MARFIMAYKQGLLYSLITVTGMIPEEAPIRWTVKARWKWISSKNFLGSNAILVSFFIHFCCSIFCVFGGWKKQKHIPQMVVKHVDLKCGNIIPKSKSKKVTKHISPTKKSLLSDLQTWFLLKTPIWQEDFLRWKKQHPIGWKPSLVWWKDELCLSNFPS